jgi:hypothetical protein
MAMTQIVRFSLAYDIEEDRLGWDTEDAAGEATRLWLTQRLSRALASAMLPLLRTSAGADAAGQHEAALQSWEQAAAMSRFGKVPSVTPQSQSDARLVRSLQIQPTAEGMVIGIDTGEAEPRSLSLADPEVRQMLEVMRRLYVTAGWPLDIWPAWMAEPAGDEAAAAVN